MLVIDLGLKLMFSDSYSIVLPLYMLYTSRLIRIQISHSVEETFPKQE